MRPKDHLRRLESEVADFVHGRDRRLNHFPEAGRIAMRSNHQGSAQPGQLRPVDEDLGPDRFAGLVLPDVGDHSDDFNIQLGRSPAALSQMPADRTLFAKEVLREMLIDDGDFCVLVNIAPVEIAAFQNRNHSDACTASSCIRRTERLESDASLFRLNQAKTATATPMAM